MGVGCMVALARWDGHATHTTPRCQQMNGHKAVGVVKRLDAFLGHCGGHCQDMQSLQQHRRVPCIVVARQPRIRAPEGGLAIEEPGHLLRDARREGGKELQDEQKKWALQYGHARGRLLTDREQLHQVAQGRQDCPQLLGRMGARRVDEEGERGGGGTLQRLAGGGARA